jgi:hypothetical protein
LLSAVVVMPKNVGQHSSPTYPTCHEWLVCQCLCSVSTKGEPYALMILFNQEGQCFRAVVDVESCHNFIIV